MFKLPEKTIPDPIAQQIARQRLGVYFAKFFHEGKDYEEMSNGRRYQFNRWSVTLYKPDKLPNGSFLDLDTYKHENYKRGIGLTDDPKTWEFVHCLYVDMESWESIKPDDDDDIQALQNYIDEFGYDENDKDWLTKTSKIVKSLRDDYPNLVKFFGEGFISEIYKLQTFFDEEYGWCYDIEEIIELICYDPTDEEWEDIAADRIDYEDIERRYGKCVTNS